MTDKTGDKQCNRDAAAFAAAEIYFDFGMYCRIKNECDTTEAEMNIDVIAAGNPDGEKGWGIAFETDVSVSEDQSHTQWREYSATFDHWYLAVPVPAEITTAHLLEEFNIDNCSLVTWQKEENEVFSFWGLPGLPSGPHKKRSMYKRITPHKES